MKEEISLEKFFEVSGLNKAINKAFLRVWFTTDEVDFSKITFEILPKKE